MMRIGKMHHQAAKKQAPITDYFFIAKNIAINILCIYDTNVIKYYKDTKNNKYKPIIFEVIKISQSCDSMPIKLLTNLPTY